MTKRMTLAALLAVATLGLNADTRCLVSGSHTGS